MMNYINACNIEAVHAFLVEGEINLEVKDKLGMTPLHVIKLFLIKNILSLQYKIIIF